MKVSLLKFNHWRRGEDKVQTITIPKTAKDAVAGTRNEQPFNSQDCSADPCSCTGCSNWD
jgi:hypothetical protein